MKCILYEAEFNQRLVYCKKKSLAVASTRHLATAYQLLIAATLFHEGRIKIHWFAEIYFRYQDVDTEHRSITYEEPICGDKYCRRQGSCKPCEDFSHAKKK